MHHRILLLCTLLSCLLNVEAIAQNITGEVVDMDNKKPIGEVDIVNVYTNTATKTDQLGKFEINGSNEQLLEFRKNGYKITHVRIPAGTIPPYFKIILEHFWAPQVYVSGSDWKHDSTNEYELYKHELEFPKLTGLDVIQHPFSAMDQRNQQVWAFQDAYKSTQEQKYIDYTFNKPLITKLTGLKGDSLTAYIKRYRPNYEMARNMNEYSLYTYIRRTVYQYRNGTSPGRLSH